MVQGTETKLFKPYSQEEGYQDNGGVSMLKKAIDFIKFLIMPFWYLFLGIIFLIVLLFAVVYADVTAEPTKRTVWW